MLTLGVQQRTIENMSSTPLHRYLSVYLLGAALALGACANPTVAARAPSDQEDTNDPLEPVNRAVFDFNMFLDRIMIKPLAQVYVTIVPAPGRHAVRHVIDNMNEPIVFANNVLQGEFARAHTTLARFLLNSTFGLGGIFDWATGEGLKAQSGDFGQTLFVWGVADGPYLILPLLGPSNPRDAVGFGVDSYADPVGYAFWNAGGLRWLDWTRFGLDGIDERAQNLDTLDDLQKNSLDFYAALRSLARQHRAVELRHGEPAPGSKLESLRQDGSFDPTAAASRTP
jgi:phospholipid-binding lipoprotein MlaA